MKRISKNTMEKKSFFAPSSKGLGATRRAAMLLVMMLTTATAWARGGSCGDNLTCELTQHEYDDFYTLTISGEGAMYDYDDPSGRPWNNYAQQIREVVIGNGVTSIGEYAFYNCHALKSVTFAEGSHLESIGANAFQNSGLTSITIPASVTSIGENVFQNCDLASMAVADGNTVYDSRNGCNAIIEISSNTLIAGCKNTTIPASVTSIRNYAFYKCTGLTSINIPAGVTSIGGSAFRGSGLTSIEIPTSVTSIGEYAFSSCNNLESVTFAEGSQLESIGMLAFERCHALTSITIPARVTSIGSYAFQNCDLASITVEDGNKVYDSRNGCNAIIVKSTNTLIIGCYNSTIPVGVTSIGNFAFSGTGLTSIEIPASVTSIGIRAFLNCPNLATVTVYAPSCSLGEDAFANCDKLANIYVFSDLVDDYKDAWSAYANKITGITGGYCGTTDHERDVVWVLTGESPNYTLTISGSGAMEDYDKPDEQPWYNCNGIETIVIENGVTSIGDNVFNGPDPTTVTIPASVTSIGAAAFGGCKDLSMVTFAPGSQLTTIGEGAFNYTGLGSIIIPASVTSIGKEVFGFCGNLSTITVEDGNKVYDSRNGCNAIIETSSNKLIAGCKNSIIPASVTSIGEYAFSGTGLTDVEIPANVTSIGAWAFDKCNYLSNVTFVGTPTLTTIGESAFSITGLTTITIPASVTSIGGTAFSNCECLTSVTFAEDSQLTSIGESAFSFTGLTTITIPASVTSIGDYAFGECSNLNSVMLNGEATIGLDAFPKGATVTIAEGMLLHNGTEPLSGNVSDMDKLNGKTLKTAYSVTFDIADDDDDPEAQIVVRGNKATVPTVARTGYTLKWKVGEEDYDFDTPVNSNITLTAVWTANNYTVQFSANGGSGDAMAPMQLTYDGDEAMLPACTYTAPEGKAFKNWNTAADGSGKSYDDKGWVHNLTGEPNGTVVLYAQWGKNIAACNITVPNQTLDDYTAVSYKFEAANSGYASTGTTVYDGETLLTLGTDYRFGNVTMANGDPIDWNGSKIGDECKVVIKGIGNYGGTIFKNFTVVSPEANGEWGDLAWTIDADGGFTISKKDGVEGNVAMNETTKGNYPWYDKAGYIKTITIGEGITTVAANAFCREMEMNVYGNVNALHLPSTLTTIGEYAFAYCTGLTVELKDFAEITYPANAFTQVGCVVGTLLDNANNANTINVMEVASTNNVTLQDRTLQAGYWNTFAVPFNAAIPNGWTVKKLTNATVEGSTVVLTFSDAESIEAGKPYLVQVESAVENPVFNNVSVSSTPAPSVFDGVISFVPTFGLTKLPSPKENILFLAANNVLKHPSAEGQNLKGFRAYFQLNGGNQARSIRLDLGENVTGVEAVSGERIAVSGATYNLSGQKVSDDYKGIVIKNGRKIAK